MKNGEGESSGLNKKYEMRGRGKFLSFAALLLRATSLKVPFSKNVSFSKF